MQIKSITSFYWKASKAAIAAIREVIKDNPEEFEEALYALKGLIDLVYQHEAAAAATEPPPESVEVPERELTRSERRRRERAKARMSGTGDFFARTLSEP